jgi:hypothetical protein
MHLGRPHRVTTMFTFRDVERYQQTKAYLAQAGLVKLSDKHLHPELVKNPPDRRAK